MGRAGTGNVRMGGQVWFGGDDARDAVSETVEAADRTDRLRDILDAVRSHRVVGDLSSAMTTHLHRFSLRLRPVGNSCGGHVRPGREGASRTSPTAAAPEAPR